MVQLYRFIMKTAAKKILNLHNPEITDRILDAIERADIDEDQQDKLEAELAKKYI